MIVTADTKSYATYSLPAFVLAFAGLPLYVVAPDFYATEMGVSLGLIAILLLGIRAFDALQDPLIGYLSDRFAHRRHLAFGVAFALFALGMAILYMPLAAAAPYALAIGMVLAATAFSIISINLNAVGSLMTADTHKKTDITAWREGFGVIGLLLAIILPVLLGKWFAPRAAFAIYAATFILCVAAVAAWFLPWLKRQDYLFRQKDDVKTVPGLRAFSFLKDFKIRFFYLTYAVSILASALPAVLVLFFIRDVLEAESLAGAFLLIYFLSGIAAIPCWRMIARYLGKEKTWACSMLLAVGAFIWAGFLGAGDTVPYIIICVVSGAALGAELILPPSILSDLIDERQTTDYTSTHFSLLAFLMKMGLAIAAALSFGLLDRAGFRAASQNTADALCMLSMLYAFIPCGLKILSAGMLFSGSHYKQNGNHNNEKDRRFDGVRSKYDARRV